MSRVPSFYLFSIQASEETRKKRLVKAKRCTEDGFSDTARRDSDENDINGQHVSRCNELADIVVQNDDQPLNDHRTIAKYYEDKLNRYLTHIERLSSQERVYDSKPELDEAMMAAAYAVSKRSQCLKRNVGAVICDAQGDIVASGFNTVPVGVEPCIKMLGDSWCFRDECLNKIGQAILFCPKCGWKLEPFNHCRTCGKDISGFSRFCPGCKSELQWDYRCPNESCKSQVFKEYLPKMLEACRSLHAEEMAIISLGKDLAKIYTSAPTERGGKHPKPKQRELRLYVTTYPCNLCANKIVEAGITHVFYSESYESLEAKDILEKGSVDVIPFEGVKSTAYFRLF